MIYWELCKRLKFEHTEKSYMHKQKYTLENEISTILSDIKIQTDQLIPARLPDLILLSKKKRNCYLMGFAVSADHREKIKESRMINKY